MSEKSEFKYQVGFQQNLNTYQWLSNINYNQIVLGKGLLDINENFNSSLLSIVNNDRKWKDDQRLTFNLFYPSSPVLGLKLAGSAYRFSDRLSSLVSDINTNWATVGVLLHPIPKVELNSEMGYKYDARLSRIDRGATYNIQLQTDPILLKEYLNQFYFLNKGDNYAIRKNNDLELQYWGKKNFQQGTVDSLTVYWSKKRRDNYDQIELNKIYIESLEEENKGFQNNLVYGVQAGVLVRLRTILNNRQTSIGKYDQKKAIEARSKKEFHSENEIGLILQGRPIRFDMALNYETNNQKNDVPDSLKARRFSKYFYYISPDYQSSRLTLSTMTTLYLFRSDTLQVNGSISRYRYDTPENNTDDRDEFRLNLSIAEIHHFSQLLKFIMSGNVNLYHLVYIFGERSANNNWMRIFRLNPQLIYQPNKKIRMVHQLELLANYVDYDYEIGSSTTDLRSYVFRRFSLAEEINTQVTDRTSIFINYKLELEENGKLDWERWTEFLLTNRESHWLRFSINYRLKDKLMISPGLLFLKRIEKRQSYLASPLGSDGQSANLTSYGPTFKIIYHPNPKMNFTFEGMRRVVMTPSMPHRFINHFDVSLTWYN